MFYVVVQGLVGDVDFLIGLDVVPTVEISVVTRKVRAGYFDSNPMAFFE